VARRDLAVRAHQLPAPPAQVLEIGCGPSGGFVPMLRGNTMWPDQWTTYTAAAQMG
jgi:hypothetical protein